MPHKIDNCLAADCISSNTRGLKIAGMKLLQVDREMAARHYAEHAQRPFYAGLIKFITSGPVVAMCIQGPGAVASVRRLMGAARGAAGDPAALAPEYARPPSITRPNTRPKL